MYVRTYLASALAVFCFGTGCFQPSNPSTDTESPDRHRGDAGDSAPDDTSPPDTTTDTGADTATDTHTPEPDTARADADAGESDGDASSACPGEPSRGLWATFEVTGYEFRMVLTSSDAISTAISIWRGNTDPKVPGGTLVCEPRQWNCGYSWHVKPGTVNFADGWIEVCDGNPAYIEDHCDSFPETYCPWSARLVDLQDCRNGTCQPVSK